MKTTRTRERAVQAALPLLDAGRQPIVEIDLESADVISVTDANSEDGGALYFLAQGFLGKRLPLGPDAVLVLGYRSHYGEPVLREVDLLRVQRTQVPPAERAHLSASHY